jgi:hypothetical protein
VPDIVITLSGPVNVSVAVFPPRVSVFVPCLAARVFVPVRVFVAVKVPVFVNVFPRVKVFEPPTVLPPPTVLNDGRHLVGTPVKVSVPVCEGKAVPLSDESGIIIV